MSELKWNLGISVSLACNMRHKFCYQSEFTQKRLSDEILYEKLGSIYPECKFISVLGGEITIIPGMKEYLRYIRSSNPQTKISIVTNGLRFDADWVELCIQERISVNFSLDASSKEAYGKLMAGGSNPYKRIKENFELALQAYREDRLLLNCISMVITDDSADDIVPFVEYAVRGGGKCTVTVYE